MPPFELPFFQDKLSFLLSVLIEDGVWGCSIGGAGGGDLGTGLSVFGGRGPAGF